MKKLVLKLSLCDDKEKQKVMTAVSRVPGLVSTAVDMKDEKLTMTGDIDPVMVMSKLKKRWCPKILTFGEEEKKEEKKDGDKKEEAKKDGDKKDGDKKEEKKVCDHMTCNCNAYNPRYMAPYYRVVMDDNPNSCVIC